MTLLSRLDRVVVAFIVSSAIAIMFFSIISPNNVYAYVSSTIILYFAYLGYSPELRALRSRIVLDAILALILIAIVVYRVYILLTTQ